MAKISMGILWLLLALPSGAAAKEETPRPALAANGALPEQKPAGMKPPAQPAQKREKQKSRPVDDGSKYNLGIGVGLFNLYLPMPAMQAVYRYHGALQVGFAVGYLTVPSSSFSGTSSYIGGDVKYFPWGLANLYLGAAFGQRRFSIATSADVTVNTEIYRVNWTRKVAQEVVIPRVGGVKFAKDGSAIALGVGYLIPLSSSLDVKADPGSVPGLESSDFEDLRAQKGHDVTEYTNNPLPHVELSYFWFL